MVEVRKAIWTGVEWRLLVRVHEGVYREEAYPVTLTYLGFIDDETEAGKQHRHVLAEVVEGLVRRQIRLGSLPPRGMLSNWREIVDRGFPTDRLDPVRDLMETLDRGVGIVIQTNGHGYYHPIERPPATVGPRCAPVQEAADTRIEITAASHLPGSVDATKRAS